jgi:hypothetical protein
MNRPGARINNRRGGLGGGTPSRSASRRRAAILFRSRRWTPLRPSTPTTAVACMAASKKYGTQYAR